VIGASQDNSSSSEMSLQIRAPELTELRVQKEACNALESPLQSVLTC
jgi:hypothetical protein